MVSLLRRLFAKRLAVSYVAVSDDEFAAWSASSLYIIERAGKR